MIATVAYTLSMLVRSQAYIAPVLLFGTAVTVLTTGDQGPLAQTYSACALTLFVCMVWVTVVLINTEERTQRAMTSVAAGGEPRLLAANVLAALVVCAGLTLVGLVYPLYAGRHLITGTALAVGALAQLTTGLAGIAAGLVCSRLVIRRAGYAVFAGLGIVGVMVLIRVIPPVAPVLTVLGSDRAPEAMVSPIAGMGAVALALLLASMVGVHWAVRRQE